VGEYAALAFNNQSNPFISYYDAFNGKLKLAYNIGGVWTKLFVPDPAPPPLAPAQQLEDSGIAPGQDITPTLSLPFSEKNPPWRDPALRLDAVPMPDVPAAQPTVVGVGKFSSIAIDAVNRVHISYHDELYGRLIYAQWSGGPWTVVPLADYTDQGDTGLWTSIAVDDPIDRPNGFDVYISFLDEKYDWLGWASIREDMFIRVRNIDRVTGFREHVGSMTSIALDKNHMPNISYVDFSNGHYLLKYARLTDKNNNIWKIEEVDKSADVGLYTSIAVTGTSVHISYYDYTHGNLRYAKGPGTWSVSGLASTGDVGLFTSLALKPDKTPSISYFDNSKGTLEFISYEGGKWVSYPTVNTMGDVGLSTSLAIGKTGVPYIAYMDDSRDYLKVAASYGSSAPGTMNPFINHLTYTRQHAGAFSSIKTYYNHPRMSFYDSDNANLMYGAYYDNGWGFWKVDTVGDVGMFNSLALDSKGLPHISYYKVKGTSGDKGDLLHAYWNVTASKFVTETVDFGKNDVGWYSSMAIDSADQPYISYYDVTNSNLVFAYKSIINVWITETVDSVGEVGLFSTLAFDKLDRPNIAYYDATNGNLKYAIKSGGNWYTYSLSTPDIDGLYSSMAMDKTPTPDVAHICYYDVTRGNLMYVTWSNGAFSAPEIVDGETGGVDTGDVGMYCSIALYGSDPGISYYDASGADLKFADRFTLPVYYQIFMPIHFFN
jgi:hypothetical protein